MQRLW